MQQNNPLPLHFCLLPHQSYHSSASNFQPCSLANVWCGLNDNKQTGPFVSDGCHSSRLLLTLPWTSCHFFVKTLISKLRSIKHTAQHDSTLPHFSQHSAMGLIYI
jgi:hypothetical protein